ncbi:NHL repeat-containing protein 2-like isoform X2 [Physella acuta]|uniref:NHL repeat-containing protein 2-like isoform X2 n=1 Tax=Physella acuta TaxID=109671 RepID=UPI0027DE2677|nr:NHL repeat-containing protein 2-like isoform X2 [Physella acuta]
MEASIFSALEIIADFDDIFHVKDIKCLDWLNVSSPLSIKNNLKGHIIVLDFFTYCCINCMHILPDLEIVEQKFPHESGVAVVGVHSAKFLNEKVTENILSAVLRYNISHPVVNDSDAILWQTLSVSCWPTLVFVGPNGQLIYSLAGEGHREKILKFLEVATDYYSTHIHPCHLPVCLEKDKHAGTGLSFPGKIYYWEDKDYLVIADTGNNRIVITDLSGVVQVVVGNGNVGLRDGDFETAEFSSPQGVTCDQGCIYVADTGNHCLRQIDFNVSKVTTLSGTGKQGVDHEGGKVAREQEISSPWDVVLGTTQDGLAPVIYIAMAGTHQIWAYFLSDGLWLKNETFPARTCVRFAGSGREENRNNSYPEKASFAQPSGLALCSKNKKLYVADSESSSIRWISLENGKVSGFVGGDKDPTNLFAFGDADGVGMNAKLQHPLGVALLNEDLIVADSYNHKIKIVDLKTSLCQTLAGTGKPGAVIKTTDLSSCEFNEPGGLAVHPASKLIYVADTNNHEIKVIDLSEKTIFKLPLVFPRGDKVIKESKDSVEQREATPENLLLPLDDITIPVSCNSVTIKLPVTLLEGEHINTEAPNSWRICALDESGQALLKLLSVSEQKGKLHSITFETGSCSGYASLTLKIPSLADVGRFTIKITAQTFACLDKSNVCLPPKQTHFKQVFCCG